MTPPAGDPSRHEEALLTLSAATIARARANRPRFLIVLGALAVLAAGGYALASWRSHAASAASYRRAIGEVTQIRTLASRLRQTVQDTSGPRFTPNPRVIAMLQERVPSRLPREALQINQLGDLDNIRIEGMTRRRFRATANNQEPDALLQWLQDATDGSIPGLEISSISLRPGGATVHDTPGWSLDVEFTRWEHRAASPPLPVPSGAGERKP